MFTRNDGTKGRDRYGHIKIRVTEDAMGNVLLCPVSERRRREVSSSNQYDGAHDVYLQQEDSIPSFMRYFPRATFVDHNGDRRINDGVVILVDSWTFRQMVGGQSD